MIFADSLILFLLHLESYLVYEKGYKVGHYNHLRMLLVGLLVSLARHKPQDNVKLLFSQFSQAYYQLLHANKNWPKDRRG